MKLRECIKITEKIEETIESKLYNTNLYFCDKNNGNIIYEDNVYKTIFKIQHYGDEQQNMYSLNFDIYNKQYNFHCISNIRNISIDKIGEIIIKYCNSLKLKVFAFIDRHNKNSYYKPDYNRFDDVTTINSIISNLFI
jgi:hypothetical protein